MAVLAIIKGEDQAVLRKQTEKVSKVTKDIVKIFKDMRETVKDAEGLGIAGPQVDVGKALCLALINGRMTAMVNPEITWKSDETSVMQEGCLSLPGIDVDVERSNEIILKYLDEKGEHQERRLHDLDARVVQHEVDHLNGVLIVDYAS